MDNEEKLLAEYGRRRPFSVPQGYFEALSASVMAEVARESAVRRVSLWGRVRKPLAVAASIVVLLGVGISYFALSSEQAEEPPVAQAGVGDKPSSATEPQTAAPPLAEPAPAPDIVPATVEQAEPTPVATVKTVAHKPAQATAAVHDDTDDAIDIAADLMMADADDLYAMMIDE